MQRVKFSDFEIIALKDTAKKINLTDDEYFGPDYKDYISNSRMTLINPEQGGSPQKYKAGFTGSTSSSLALGSAVHQLYLQPDEFILVEGLRKPSAKLGLMIDRIKYYRAQNYSIRDSIIKSSADVDYYANSLTVKRVQKVIKEGLYYYLNSRGLGSNNVVLSDADTEKCKSCLNSLTANKKITNTINSTDLFGDPLETFNEDAFFMDVKVIYKGKSVVLPLKMKADNWNINAMEKMLMLNDLKTTGKQLQYFMSDSFGTWHYARQMAMYSWILKKFCEKEYDFDNTWSFKANMMVVETNSPFNSQIYSVNRPRLKEGMREFNQMLKRIAYHEIYGYDKEVNFV